MSDRDSHEAGPPYTYECTDCENRVEADHPRECPECGGETQNISVSREQ